MKTLFVITGPSGSGKTSLVNLLKDEKQGVYTPECISHTTRKKRNGEIDGYDYYFVTEEEFWEVPSLEYSNYSGNHYSLSVAEVNRIFKKNNRAVVIVDYNGYKQIKEKFKGNLVSIFIDLDLDTMKERMKLRGDKDKDIEKRLNNAIKNKEHKNKKHYDYVLNNNKPLNETFEELKKIVLKYA